MWNVSATMYMYLNDGDFPMLLVHASHVCIEVQCLLVVAVSNTGLHDLRNLKNLQQLSVLRQSKGIQLPSSVCERGGRKEKKRENN